MAKNDLMFPEPDFFKVPKNSKQHLKKMTITRKRAYEAYIEWSSKPRALRDPRTVKEFENNEKNIFYTWNEFICHFVY